MWFEGTVSVAFITYAYPIDVFNLLFNLKEDVNCYCVKTCDEYMMKVPEKMTLTSSEPTIFPMPSSELLALHAVCAKVAHLSGAREQIDEFDCDLEAWTY
jgi:hypothetical protein